MDPISNQIFSYDYERFVLQKQNIPIINNTPHQIEPPKFDIEKLTKAKRTKKDMNKEKSKEREKNKKYKNPFFK